MRAQLWEPSRRLVTATPSKLVMAAEQQEQRPDAEAGKVAVPKKTSALSRRRVLVGTAVVHKGKRLGVMQGISAVTFIILTFLCANAYTEAERECASSPEWFMAALVMHCICGLCCFLAMYMVLSVMHKEIVMARSSSRKGSSNAEAPDDEEPLSACELNTLLVVSIVMAVMALLLFAWTIVGFVSLSDADRPEMKDSCKKGADNLIYIMALTLIAITCCSCCSMTDVHITPKPVIP